MLPQITASSTVQLSFRCEDLADVDVFSKSDAFLVLYDTTHPGPPRQIGRTETVDNCLNPTFSRTFVVDYNFEMKQKYCVELYDDDGSSEVPDTLGRCAFSLSQVVSSLGSTSRFALKPKGALYVSAVERSNAGSDTVVLYFRGEEMKNMDTYSLSDCYFTLRRVLPNGGVEKPLYRSEVIDDDLNPKWKPTPELRVSDLTFASHERASLRFSCYDKDVFFDDPMGHVDLSFDNILEAETSEAGPFLLHDSSGEAFGKVFLAKTELKHRPTFLEFLNAGLKLNLTIAIDFTASNGDPRRPSSLHNMSDMANHPNQYVRAIRSVGEVLMPYAEDSAGVGGGGGNGQQQQQQQHQQAVGHINSSSKDVLVLGFGAILPNGSVSHCFPINNVVCNNNNSKPSDHSSKKNQQDNHDSSNNGGDSSSVQSTTSSSSSPCVQGIDGVLSAYKKAMNVVQLAGPTNFAPIISQVVADARRRPNNQYSILLIVTDGEISDMGATCDELVHADDVGLSVIIVGVGACEFELMSELDGDEVKLVSRGRVSRRDAVQFVAFRHFEDRPPSALAAEVLREVPRQVTEWAALRKLDPFTCML